MVHQIGVVFDYCHEGHFIYYIMKAYFVEDDCISLLLDIDNQRSIHTSPNSHKGIQNTFHNHKCVQTHSIDLVTKAHLTESATKVLHNKSATNANI